MTLRMDTETYVVLSGGRRGPADVARRGRRGRRPRRPGARRDGRDPVSRGTGWTREDIPDLTGRRALVTGVTSGLGQVVVATLARHGAEVLLAARDEARLAATVARIAGEQPEARLRPLLVDLADQSSVRRGAADAATYGPLHLLVNNAGVMATPYARTSDHFELQMATNVLGHFTLTGLLWPRLVESGGARVVSVSSQAPPDGPVGAARRPARAGGPLPAVADVRPDQARQPAVHLRARPPRTGGGAARAGARRAPRAQRDRADGVRTARPPRRPDPRRRRSRCSGSPPRWARCRC